MCIVWVTREAAANCLTDRNLFTMAFHIGVQLEVVDQLEGHERMCNSCKGMLTTLGK